MQVGLVFGVERSSVATMSDEIPDRIRNMTRRDVLQAVRDGIFQCRKLDGTPFTFPPSDRIPSKRNGSPPKAPPPLKTIVKRSHRLIARMRTYSEQDAHCFYCNRHQHFSVWTLDHKTPVSRGGRGGNNIVGACYYCNQQKGCLTLDEFLELRHNLKLMKAKIAEIQAQLLKTRQ